MSDAETTSVSFIRAFIALQASGAIGLSLLLLTALISRQIHRDLTWFNFCLTWIISCISYLLLPIAGQQTGTDPDYILCLTQASLVYAVPPLTACSTLALVVQLWLNVNSAPLGSTSRRKRFSGLITLILLIVPYSISLVTFVASLVVGLRWPDSVSRAKSSVYCGMNIRLPGQVSAILVAIIMGAAVLLEIFIVFSLYHNWRLLKSLDARTMHSMKTSLRVGTFTLFSILSITVAPVYLSAVMAPIPNIIIGLTPVSAVLVFGTQTDLLRAWIFWKIQPPTPDTNVDCDFVEMLKDEPHPA